MWHLIAGDFNGVHIVWEYKRLVKASTAAQLHSGSGIYIFKWHRRTRQNRQLGWKGYRPRPYILQGTPASQVNEHAYYFIKWLGNYTNKCGHTSGQKQTKHGITDWNQICMERQTVQARSVPERAQQLETLKKQHRKYLQQHSDQPSADNQLLQLWEARLGLARLWKKHKRNRTLKGRIHGIKKEIRVLRRTQSITMTRDLRETEWHCLSHPHIEPCQLTHTA